MIIDTSVLIAILLNEPETEQLIEAMSANEERLISAVSMVEVGIVILNRKGEAGLRELDSLIVIVEAAIVVVLVDTQQAQNTNHDHQSTARIILKYGLFKSSLSSPQI